MQENGRALESADPELKADRDIVLAAVQQWGCALQHAADELRADRKVVMAAIKQSGEALQYAADELRADRGVVTAAVEQRGVALQYAADELRADRKLLLEAMVNNEGDTEYDWDPGNLGESSGLDWALGFASSLMADRDFVLEAFQFAYAFRGLKAVLDTVLEYTAPELRADPEFLQMMVNEAEEVAGERNRENGSRNEWVPGCQSFALAVVAFQHAIGNRRLTAPLRWPPCSRLAGRCGTLRRS